MQQTEYIPSIARRQFANKFAGELNGALPPCKKFFSRVVAKFEKDGTVIP